MPADGQPSEERRSFSLELPSWVALPGRAETGAALLVVAVVVLANVLYLSGAFDADPLSSFAVVGPIVHKGVLGGLYTIDPNAGFTSQALGHLAATDLLHAKLPWWNPYEGAGSPLAGEMQGAALFPPTLLLWFTGGQLWVRMLLQAVAGLSTFRLLRRLDVNAWISAALGSVFALDGTFSWFMHAPANPIAFLPLLLLGIERARAAAVDGRRLDFALIALAIALSAYAGFPETAYLDGLLGLVWAIVRIPRTGRATFVRYGGRLGAGLVTGALLAAPIAIAFADYLPYATAGPHNASVFNLVHVVRPGAGALFFPYLFGPIFGFYQSSKTLLGFWSQTGGYLTTSLLALDVLALFGRRHRPLRIALGAWLVLALGRIYGVQPFWRAFDLLPYMGHVGAYRYLWPSVELAAVVLAALAVDDVRRGAVARWKGAVALVGAAGIAAGTAASGGSVLSAIGRVAHSGDWSQGSLVWGFAVLVVAGALAIVGRGRWCAAVLCVLVAADAGAMFVLPELSAPRQVNYDAPLVTWLEQHATTRRFFTLGPVQPNYGSYFGMMEADVNDVPTPKAYARYIHHALDPNTPLSFTGTVVLHPSGPTPLEELERHVAGYEAIGVAYVVTSPGEIPPAIVEKLGMREVYGDAFAEVFALPRHTPYYSATAGCTLSRETASSVVARCAGQATLVRQELFLPGTAATVTSVESGRTSTVTVRRKGVAESLALSKGTSRVSISYTPPHEDLGAAAFAIGIVALIGPAVLGERVGRRRRRSSAS
jgi:hypothetical protein